MVLFFPCEGAGQQASLDSEAAVEPHLSTVTPELYPHHQQLLFTPSKDGSCGQQTTALTQLQEPRC